ncbi:MAG: hypothetical protein HQM09_18915 [Candidatus Riflebacteria bacterium]|nr:hypothetical protein [Candidatus Riflebacteria bacterium]
MTDQQRDPLPVRSTWGIVVSECETDIDITVSPPALNMLKIASGFFSIMYFLTLLLSLVLCYSAPEREGISGILKTVTQFSGKVPEAISVKLTPGTPCRIALTAYPERIFSGTLESIGEKGEYDLSLGYSLFPVTIRVENPDRLLRIGMSGSATF